MKTLPSFAAGLRLAYSIIAHRIAFPLLFLGAGLLLVELFTAGLGSVYGIATFIAGKKY